MGCDGWQPPGPLLQAHEGWTEAVGSRTVAIPAGEPSDYTRDSDGLMESPMEWIGEIWRRLRALVRSRHATEEPGVHSRRDSVASDRHRGEYRDFQRGECDSPEVHACSRSRTVASGAVDGRTENSYVYRKRLFNHAARHRGAQLVL